MGRVGGMKSFSTILKERHQRFRRLFAGDRTNCFRVYDRNDALYPYTIDLYDRRILITEYEGTAKHVPAGLKRNELEAMVASSLYVDPHDVFYKFRPRLHGRTQYEKLDNTGELFPVTENGLTFLVNLTDYVDTGLFMDHRLTRKMVAEESFGLRVLNLFGYTGAFSVAAAAGGALETVTVDLSSSYLAWAEKNLRVNGFIGDQHRFIAEDVRKYLMEADKERSGFDLVILDPPLFSNSRKTDGTFDLQRDYVWFVAAAMKLLNDGGRLLFCTTKKEFHFDPGRIMGSESLEITRETLPPDFDARKPHRCWLLKRKTVTVVRKNSSHDPGAHPR
ncbi:rRNA (guanine-N(2)-)-methyltransferase [Sediminispirochaeta smaragdinae DSM 11293]|uniref:rRNA (Guanine-N(2)-)-methyltransferase n=2 Tax=Sediminispirochaeta TaxID=1911556 RepID=E1R571_SEDSS|nr:rRNA (guanine-N(2)-)-methyltransferase [Sediminispirochaeta smaragdinae DSM 11293]